MKSVAWRFLRQFVSTLLFVSFYISGQQISTAQALEMSTNGKWAVNTNSVLNAPIPPGADLPDDAPRNQVEEFRNFKKIATDKKSTDEKIFWSASSYLANWCWEDNDFEPVTRVLGTNRAPYLMKLIRGNRFIGLAWNARGGDYASKVVPSQWPIFEEYLKKAAAELEAAWNLNQQQPLIAERMMTVELGRGMGRDQLELWFKRAMQLDTNNVEACCRKLLYLEPKWYGSAKDEIAFGRECVASADWGGKVPLMLVQAHRALTEYLPEEKRAAYWQLPLVWNDVQSAYNKYFKANPKDLVEHKNYAVLAYTGQHWDVLNEQLAVLGPDNYGLLGNEDKIFDIVGAAKRHAEKSN